jgi:hypothetical protein
MARRIKKAWDKRDQRGGLGEAREWKNSLHPKYGIDVSPTGLVPILKYAEEHCGVPEELTEILQRIIAFSK